MINFLYSQSRYKVMFIALLGVILSSSGICSNKKTAVQAIRKQMAENRSYLHYSIRSAYNKEAVKKAYNSLQKDGKFSDLNLDSMDMKKHDGAYQNKIVSKLFEANKRIRFLAQAYFNGIYKSDKDLKKKLFKSIIYYSNKEMSRKDAWFRFHASCFGIPNIAYGTYFIFFEDFDAAEKGKSKDKLALAASKALRGIMMQTFTQPKRDDTNNSIDVKQFRKHCWWVGGNFAYRPLFEAAAVCSNPKMFDVISTVCEKAMSPVSWNTRNTAFWSEGMTSDGAGWGHGNQCYVWGYPLHGLRTLVGLCARFKGTPWETKKNIKQIGSLANYIDGMSWYQWRQFQTLLSPGRVGFIAGAHPSKNEIVNFAGSIVKFDIPKGNKAKIERISKQISAGQDQNFGNKSFWNNDDMVQRRKDYYLGVSMMSARTVSNEVVKGSSTHTDNLGDGTTFIMNHPGEYKRAKGFWNYTALPGTTLRQGKIQPHTIWAGYTGTKNFAANVSDGELGCAGFISEKVRKKVPNECLFDLSSVKAYFMFDDEFVALGNSIENKSAKQKGEIWTTIDQSQWRGNLLFGIGDEVKSIKQGQNFRKILKLDKKLQTPWIVEDGIAYIILPEFTTGKLVVRAEHMTKNNWTEIDKRNSSKDKQSKLDMFHIYINHGNNPKTDKYAYIVNFRLKDKVAVKEYMDNSPIKILSNSSKLQAVAHRGLKTREMIFYSSEETCRDGKFKLKVNKPAAVIFRELPGNKVAISVSDPRQLPAVKSITLLTSMELEGNTAKAIRKGTKITINLPGKPYCGKSVTQIFDKK